MIVVESADGIAPDAFACQDRGECRQEAHGVQRAVHVAGDHAARKGVIGDAVGLGRLQSGDDGETFGFVERHLTLQGGGWGGGMGICEEDEGGGVQGEGEGGEESGEGRFAWGGHGWGFRGKREWKG